MQGKSLFNDQNQARLSEAKQASTNSSSQQKWQNIIKCEQEQQKTPFLMSQQSFNSSSKMQQFYHQKQMMTSASIKGRQMLVQKQYLLATKQLSKTLMAFQFIVKNHMNNISKDQIKEMMIEVVLKAYNNLSLCYLKLQDYNMVQKFTNQVLAQNADNVKARYRRAVALMHLKKFQQATNDFIKVKQQDIQMSNECDQKVKQCKRLSIQQIKQNQRVAKKFLSGYKRDQTQENTFFYDKSAIKQKKSKQNHTYFNRFMSFVKQNCNKCKQYLTSKIQSNQKATQKSN